MKFNAFTLSACALVTVAGTASAQPIWVSGLAHRAVGTGVLEAPAGRRLPVNNLGSSGEDGVEIQMRSTMGGSTAIDIAQLLAPSSSARQIKYRPKGWDGTIKGTYRLQSVPGTPLLNEIYDLSMVPGVISLQWRLLDVAGNVLASGETPGPIMEWFIHVPGTANVACNKVYSFGGQTELSARSAEQGFFDRVISVTGLTPTPIDGVQSISVTPRTCLGCPPPFVDLDSVIVTSTGLSSFAIDEDSLLTFGVGSGAGVGKPIRNWGTGSAHIAEVPAGDLDGDGVADRLIRTTNIGSSGQDGVAIDFRQSGSGGGGGGAGGGATWSVSHKCCRGHVIIMKLYDDGESEQARVSNTTDPVSDENALHFDASMIGSPECFVDFRDSAGNTVFTRMLPPGEPVFYTACPDSSPFERWTASPNPASGEQELHFRLCGDTNHFRLSDGISPPGAVEAVFRPATGSLHHSSRVTIAGSGLSSFDIALAANLPPTAPPCDPDANQDGNVDQDDITYLINVVGGGDNPTGMDPDFNHDGNIDQDDVLALLNVVAGGPCP